MSSVKKINANSGSAGHSSLSIFSVPPTNVSIIRSHIREILPMNSIEESPYEIKFSSDNLWVDLSKTYLYLQLSIQKKSGNNWVALEATDTDVAFINGIGSAFVRQMLININGTEVYDSSNHYGYMSYIKTLLNCSENVKKSMLATSGFYLEKKLDDATDEGFKKRVALTGSGKICEIMSRLDFDLANQPLFLLNNLDILFTIYRSDDSFLIQTLKANDGNSYRVKLHALKIFVKMVEVTSSVNLAVMNMLSRTSAKYPTRRTEIRTCYISSNRTELTYQVFSNITPRKLIVAFVKHDAYRGSLKLSPWNFKHFNLRELNVTANGQTYPSVPLNMKYDGDQTHFIRAYTDMITNSINSDNLTNGITLDQFVNGWALFIVPMNSTLDDCCGYDLIRNSTTTIQLVFNDLIPNEGVTMIVIGEFDQLLQIDQQRIVLSDNTV